MRRLKSNYFVIAMGLFVAVLAVACSPDSTTGSNQLDTPTAPPAEQDETAAEPTGEPMSEEPAVEESAAEDSADAEEQGGVEEGAEAAAPAELGQLSLSWTTEQVGTGIKPALGVDSGGVAHVAFLTEAEHGGVFYAQNASGSFEEETVAEGYFYGPVDLALSDQGIPYIAYHDHQAAGFDPNLGDEVVAVLEDGTWNLVTVADDGHDGWDNAIVVDSAGNWHTAAVDPAQFGSQAGIEYATNAGGDVTVEMVGSGPIVYEFGTSIQLDNEELPGIAYYDNNTQTLAYARRGADGLWSVETVDENGDAGRYASLAYDTEGNPHISYYAASTETSGTVRHAWWDGSAWQIEDVDTLDDVQMGRVGARKITALAIDGDGRLHIAYTDRSRLVYGLRSDDGWAVQELPRATGNNFLGQLVELELDSGGNPHLVWFEVESFAPLSGPIIYASTS